MGFTYRGVSSDYYKLIVKTTNYVLLPEKRASSEDIIGRDGAHSFEDGYKPREHAFLCTLVSDFDYVLRRLKMHEIAAWLSQPGELTFNCEPGKKYNARVVKMIDAPPGSSLDEFVVVFETQPIGTTVNTSLDLTWDEAAFSWNEADILWQGETTEFLDVTEATTLTVNNIGNYVAMPTIVVAGTAASLTLTDDNGNSQTITNLSGTLYIDCKNKLVYSLSGPSKVNQRHKLIGRKYISLRPGNNTIDVSGDITSVSIAFYDFAGYL